MKFEKLFCKIDESQNKILLKDVFIKIYFYNEHILIILFF